MSKPDIQRKVQILEDNLKKLEMELGKIADLLPVIGIDRLELKKYPMGWFGTGPNSLISQIRTKIHELPNQIKRAIVTGVPVDVSEFIGNLMELKKFLGDKEPIIRHVPGTPTPPPARESYPQGGLRPQSPRVTLPTSDLKRPTRGTMPITGVTLSRNPAELITSPLNSLIELINTIIALLRDLKSAGVVKITDISRLGHKLTI
ncbi:MAG: hypothetical protein ACFFC7_04980 [Candidatus Hermodarchaeota archaeon]